MTPVHRAILAGRSDLAKSLENAFVRPDHVSRRGSVQRSRPPLELRSAVSRQADHIFTGICRRWYALWYAEALTLPLGRPSVFGGDWRRSL
jgi:hypothetical protein